jgi:hypothetical protein
MRLRATRLNSISSGRLIAPVVLSAWTPAQLSGLALWLDADDSSTVTLNGSAVSQWDDKSGNARNFTQSTAANQPTYLTTGFNGKSTLQTDGNDSLVLGVNGLGRNVSGLTCAIVGLHPAAATFIANATELFISNGSVATTTRFLTTPNPSISTGNRYAIGGRRLDADSFATVSSSTDSPANRGNPWVRIAQRAYSDGVANHWTNGTQDLTNEVIQTAGNTSNSDSLAASIFAGVGSIPNGSQLSEIVLTHSTMTNDDRQKLEGYLAWKWGLVADLPANHPYKFSPPTVGEPTYDADAQAYIGAVQAADSAGLEPTVKTAINDFVVGCKADGIWDAIKSSCILAGARTLAGALVPLRGTAPTNFNFVAGDYNRKTGLLGNGTTKYLDSNRNNNADPQNSSHTSVYVSTAQTTILGAYIGLANASGSNNIGQNIGTLEAFFRNRNIDPSVIAGTHTGFIGHSRASSATFTARASSADSSFSVISQAPANASTLVYTRNLANYANARLAFYSIGESLNLALLDARVTTLVNHLAFFINTGLNPVNYDADTIAYVNAGYAAGGTLS